jgi:protein arginine kinase activator
MFSEGSDWDITGGGSQVCESCGEQPATVHVARIEGGSVTHSHLCQSCAEELGEQSEGTAIMFAVPAALGRLFSNLVEKSTDVQAEVPGGGPVCAVCGTTLGDLRETGLVGCAACYQVFAEHLQETPSLPGSPRQGDHLGKVPNCPAEGAVEQMEVLRLQRMLRELVEHERYEEAASVRDRLAELGG